MLPWGRLRDWLGHLPADAALWRSMDHPRQWGWAEHLTAAALYATQMGNWQRGGGKGRRPKPVKPPGKTDGDQKTFGTPVPLEEMRRLLDEWPVDPEPPKRLLGPDGQPLIPAEEVDE